MTKQRSKIGLVLILGCVAVGCGVKTINQVLADPSKYRNESVTVRGTVAESASVLGRGAYRITDGNQGLWVVTSNSAPRKGARVNVTGRVEQGYDLSAFGNVLKLPGSLQSPVVLVESSHKER